jgi:hypothetical protein
MTRTETIDISDLDPNKTSYKNLLVPTHQLIICFLSKELQESGILCLTPGDLIQILILFYAQL